jgi:hypothetical protein
MHGPSATQPAQQNGRPTWNTGVVVISASQVTQVKGSSVAGRRMQSPWRAAGRHPDPRPIDRGSAPHCPDRRRRT